MGNVQPTCDGTRDLLENEVRDQPAPEVEHTEENTITSPKPYDLSVNTKLVTDWRPQTEEFIKAFNNVAACIPQSPFQNRSSGCELIPTTPTASALNIKSPPELDPILERRSPEPTTIVQSNKQFDPILERRSPALVIIPIQEILSESRSTLPVVQSYSPHPSTRYQIDENPELQPVDLVNQEKIKLNQSIQSQQDEKSDSPKQLYDKQINSMDISKDPSNVQHRFPSPLNKRTNIDKRQDNEIEIYLHDSQTKAMSDQESLYSGGINQQTSGIFRKSGSDVNHGDYNELTEQDGSKDFPKYPNQLSDTDEMSAMTDMAHDGDDESTIVRRRDGLRATTTNVRPHFISPHSLTRSSHGGSFVELTSAAKDFLSVIDADTEYLKANQSDALKEGQQSIEASPETGLQSNENVIYNSTTNEGEPQVIRLDDAILEDNSVHADGFDDSAHLRDHAYTARPDFTTAFSSDKILAVMGHIVQSFSSIIPDHSYAVPATDLSMGPENPSPSHASRANVAHDNANQSINVLQPRNVGNLIENVAAIKEESVKSENRQERSNSSALSEKEIVNVDDTIMEDNGIIAGIVGEDVEPNPHRSEASDDQTVSVYGSVAGPVIEASELDTSFRETDSVTELQRIITVKGSEVTNKQPIIIRGSETEDGCSVKTFPIMSVHGIRTNAELNSVNSYSGAQVARSRTPRNYGVIVKPYKDDDSVSTRKSKQQIILEALQNRPSTSAASVSHDVLEDEKSAQHSAQDEQESVQTSSEYCTNSTSKERDSTKSIELKRLYENRVFDELNTQPKPETHVSKEEIIKALESTNKSHSNAIDNSSSQQQDPPPSSSGSSVKLEPDGSKQMEIRSILETRENLIENISLSEKPPVANPSEESETCMVSCTDIVMAALSDPKMESSTADSQSGEPNDGETTTDNNAVSTNEANDKEGDNVEGTDKKLKSAVGDSIHVQTDNHHVDEVVESDELKIMLSARPSSPAARALEAVTSRDHDEIQRLKSIDFDGIDLKFVEQYEETFNSFLEQNQQLFNKNRLFIEMMRVAKLQKILSVTAEVEAELVDYVASLESQKKSTTTYYHNKLLEAAKKKAAREIQLQQELNTIQQATQLMESKLTWQVVSRSEARAKKYVQILEHLDSSKKIDPQNPLSIMPSTVETQALVDAVEEPPSASLSGVAVSSAMRDEQAKDLRQYQIDNAFLNAEALILERKLLYVQQTAKQYSWIDSVFRRLTAKQHKMLKQRYHQLKNDDIFTSGQGGFDVSW